MPHACHRFGMLLEMPQNPHALLIVDKVHNPQRMPRKTKFERAKAVRTCGGFNILTWKRASRHNGVHFFDMSTSKSAPKVRCFVHFDFETRFAPQRRPLFQHVSFLRKYASRHNGVHFFDISTSKSGPTLVCFVHFDLEMCFAPQRRAIFHLSSGQLAPHPPL